MEQPDQIPVQKNLERLTVLPYETKKETKESSMTPQPKNHDKDNMKLVEKDKVVDISPEEEEKKKLVRQSDRSVSSTSTCSSVNDSSPESDQVFSEEEEIQSKRKTLRKTKSWKTFFTMVHWSLKRQNSWVQLAGHEGNFKASERGHILKKFSPIENACLEALMEDILQPYVPSYHGLVEREDQTYIKMEDLLMGLEAPSIMDCKMGFRTYLEDELAKALLKPTPRKDLYNKMVALDPQAPTLEEHLQKAVTKPRYMQWRESVSSTAEMGFRIEGVTIEAGSVKKNFKKMKNREKIMETFVTFTKSRQDILVRDIIVQHLLLQYHVTLYTDTPQGLHTACWSCSAKLPSGYGMSIYLDRTLFSGPQVLWSLQLANHFIQANGLQLFLLYL